MLMENLKSEELLVNEEVMDLPDVDPHFYLSRHHCSDNDHEDDDMKDNDEGNGGE